METKPLFRGRIHQIMFVIALVGGIILGLRASTPKEQLAAGAYSFTMALCFGTSAIYHRCNWQDGMRRWLRQLDHSMIAIFIGGTYIPFALIILSLELAVIILSIVWGIAVLAVLQSFIWIEASRWITVSIYLVMGGLGISVLHQMLEAIGWTGLILVVMGLTLYAAGAVVYASKRPNPFPRVFGFHEIWHLLTAIGAMAHFVTIALYVVPR